MTNLHLKKESIFKIITTVVVPVILLIVLALLEMETIYKVIIYILLYLLIGGEVIVDGYKSISKNQFYNEKVLILFSTIVAFILGKYAESIVVMLIFQIGDFLQCKFVEKSKKVVVEPFNMHAKQVTVKENSVVNQVDADSVENGDIVIVNPGELIQFDGRVVLGSSTVNSCLISGEDNIKEVEIGDKVLAGYINSSAVIEIKVLKESNESTVDNIYKEVKKAGERKSRIESSVANFSNTFSLLVILAAIITAVIPALFLGDIEKWIYKGLTMLIISSPCAIILSVPVTFFAGLGSAARNGGIVKGGDYLERLNYIDTVVFNKTGTLTKGEFSISNVIPAEDVEADLLIEVAAFAETISNHPIAETIKKYFGKNLDVSSIDSYEEKPGEGVIVAFGNRTVAVGNERLMQRENIAYTLQNTLGTVVYVAMDGEYLGAIIIADDVRDESDIAVKELKSAGVRKVSILAGDNDNTTRKISQVLYADDYSAELSPEQKASKIEQTVISKRDQKANVMFVGNGVNDAEAIKRADIGVAMGNIGNEYSMHIADIVMLTDNPRKLTTLLKIAKKTKNIVLQNVVFAVAIKVLMIFMSVFFNMPMWLVIMLDIVVSLAAILNGLRMLKSK